MSGNLTPSQVAEILTVTAREYEHRASLCRATALALMETRAVVQQSKPKAKRSGDSDGGLHGRILSVLREAGEPLSPADVVKRCKAPDWQVRLSCKELVADGRIVAAGATTNKTYALAVRS